MAKSIIEVAKEVLERKKEALNPNRMYHIAKDLDLISDLNLGGKTPWASFGARIYIDIKGNPNSVFEVVSTKPMLIKLKNQDVSKPVNLAEQISPKEPQTSYCERDLHILLTRFVFVNDNFKAYTKTIYHESSKKAQKGVDKWLYPDIVGVSFEYRDYQKELSKFINKFSTLPVKIYAFEMKKHLNVSSFREYYFQAVSNSSWANEGYLVALDIDESDEELMDLIKRMSGSFGIGVISLSSQNVDESVILARAKFKESLDYSVMNELSSKNPDFKKFLESVEEFNIEKEYRSIIEFDKVLDNEKLENYLKEKKIKD
ncbi:putative restriction endonuclease-replacing protein HrgA [Campylobacter iguaniorum]|uniref:Putative restriction endonuclease-replacing protein HrgA n=1 Tax=Campylobacter iguaniorum TaxID=1244531 RepID=A0A076FDN9_9BACT|nr:HTH domain-containing protein [Campylobacter iguaniorum]AII15512.1 putative restriction endonuclease-replacing protein HrgA [Campylobacter iguaniorum]ALV25426.1 putative restriction endonuclease-replacing protein HrgA [Campylobacter iguaniorum]